ncbi:MAG: hypothetical protein FWB96_09455 [Defluviitaleaceae bacterium]|nr:hypothetical protein [Defluviitaleaceae bacterium]MCL2263431.1 hypothetical protein [Defluviitaleaceae bacterium]
MQKAKYYGLLCGLCTVSAVAGIALGYFIFGPIGVNAGVSNSSGGGKPAPYSEYYPAYKNDYAALENETAQEEPTHSYILTVNDGYIVVLHAGAKDAIMEVTSTPVNALPLEEQARLEQGIRLYSEEALFRILEDYGS